MVRTAVQQWRQQHGLREAPKETGSWRSPSSCNDVFQARGREITGEVSACVHACMRACVVCMGKSPGKLEFLGDAGAIGSEVAQIDTQAAQLSGFLGVLLDLFLDGESE